MSNGIALRDSRAGTHNRGDASTGQGLIIYSIFVGQAGASHDGRYTPEVRLQSCGARTEDETLVSMVAELVLSEAGYSVISASNADQALAVLSARPDVSILFTDVKMPGSLDGFMLAHIVRKKHPNVRILVTSGQARPGKGDLPPGAMFLPKAYSPTQLLNAIENTLTAS